MLVKQVADQLSLALENARLFQETQTALAGVERSEGELRALFAAMTDVIIVLDKEPYLRIAPTNPSRLIKPADELIGRSTDEMLPSDAARSVKSAIDEALRTGETVNLEYSLEINQQDYWFEGVVSKLTEDQVFLVSRDITDHKYSETLQRAVTQITEAALSTPDITSLIKIIHENVNSLMPARNFYIALYDERNDLMSFPYFVDEHDSPSSPQKPGRFDQFVLRTGKPLLVTSEVFDDPEKSGKLQSKAHAGLIGWAFR